MCVFCSPILFVYHPDLKNKSEHCVSQSFEPSRSKQPSPSSPSEQPSSTEHTKEQTPRTLNKEGIASDSSDDIYGEENSSNQPHGKGKGCMYGNEERKQTFKHHLDVPVECSFSDSDVSLDGDAESMVAFLLIHPTFVFRFVVNYKQAHLNTTHPAKPKVTGNKIKTQK